MFNFFEELFAPGRKHAAEEQKRLELTRVDLGVGDPGRGPIDLASGKVVIRASGAGDEANTNADADADRGPDQETAPETDAPGGRS
ncbi:DUF6191 domain-containing protein [Streptomyces sp. NBC_01363]|uniref:DUF6191 domain-containing protein n=1 Tax=Streptomyces sp. NBC_01363 TaxID=2903840 RepID=UPI002256E358|nr:DUF6191 domain-containing protein [Streptomyces sp. NBC_01363]MCX4734924.1 DUF6191 domain-containing protein [Streptomyces sp. NBC_01363]